MPLLFNILAAGNLLFSILIPIGNISEFLLTRQLSFTIKEESILPADYNGEHSYHVVLHVENTSGQKFFTHFILGDYGTVTPGTDVWDDHELGYDSDAVAIPSGVSNIIVDVPVEDRMVCQNGINLAKPLYLLYSSPVSKINGYAAGYHGPLAADSNINKSLQEIIVCSAAP
jgi:hypothetical protein